MSVCGLPVLAKSLTTLLRQPGMPFTCYPQSSGFLSQSGIRVNRLLQHLIRSSTKNQIKKLRTLINSILSGCTDRIASVLPCKTPSSSQAHKYTQSDLQKKRLNYNHRALLSINEGRKIRTVKPKISSLKRHLHKCIHGP
jgi:hypothetical protein